MFNFLKNIFGVKANEASINEVAGVSFLTIGKVNDTTTTGNGPIKRYMGIGVCRVLVVNPTAAEIEKYMGFTPKAEPVYLGEDQNGCKTARISVIVATVPEDNNDINVKAFLTFNMTASTVVSQTGKTQVMDDFGSDLVWGDSALVDANKPIVYSDGRSPYIGQYHKVCRGEFQLTKFLRAFLSVPNAQNYVNGTWVRKEGKELEDAKLRLENIPNYFKGDFSEIKEAIALMPDNKVKLLFGVRTNDEGKEYQDVNNEVFMTARSNSTKMMERIINDAKANGRYANTEYDFEPLHEYVVAPTDFSATEASTSDLPFSSTPWLN